MYDNEEKGTNYTIQFKRLEKAIQNGYYYEAIVIEYAMLEDRSLAILYYLDLITPSRKNINANFKKFKMQLLIDKGLYRLEVRGINNKLSIIEYIMRNYKNNHLIELNPEYFKYLSKKNINLVADGLIELVSKINDWTSDRNKIIHSLLSTNKAKDINEKEFAENGFKYVRDLDKYCKKIKMKKIRERS